MLRSYLAAFLLLGSTSSLARANGVATFDGLTEGYLGPTFTSGGITFSSMWNGIVGDDDFACENASTTFAGFPGFSSPNVLAFAGYVPGGGAGYHRIVSFEATTGQIETIAHVNLLLSAVHPGNQIRLEAWLGGTLAASTSYTIPGPSGFFQTQLSLYDVPYDHIVVRGVGAVDGGAFFACVDEVALYYTPPIPGGQPFCSGDGQDPTAAIPCPCGNTGAARHGCANSVNPLGAELLTSGSLAQDRVVLEASGMPATSSCIYLQGDQLVNAVFGDGVRCTGGNLLRLRTRTNANGASRFPDATDTVSLSQRGGVQVGSGVLRFYQTYYRNASAQFCPPETFNVTNGSFVIW
ncbi:MAG: hypothetical protein HZA53_13350 [Planctomycetes bacterium]|nr:hypothetical protein [Planctomycetota bacterium]